jgi:hypothetical protein
VENLVKILLVILFSSVKFALGPSYVYFNENYQFFTFWQTNLYTIIGGMLGVVFFMYFSEWIIVLYRKARKSFRKHFRSRQGIFSRPVADADGPMEIHYDYIDAEKKKRIFSRKSRRIVRLSRRYGVIGMSALTPILSIPVGMFILTRLEKNHKKIILYMLISVSCWSLLLTTIFELAHVRNIPEIMHTVPLIP